MTLSHVAAWIIIIAGALFSFREADRRWSLFMLWGWRGSPIRCIKAWVCFRLTGVMPQQPQIDIAAHVAEHKRTSLLWTILGSSK